MAYARLSNSHWYAFWQAGSKPPALCFMGANEVDKVPGAKDVLGTGADFSDCDFPTDIYFNTLEIRKSKAGCLLKLREKNKSATEADMQEALRIIETFEREANDGL